MSWKIKTGSASTAGWAHLVESTDSPAPQSVSINLQNADSLVWEARTGEHWDAPNHQKVIFEYPTGTVRFRGRFKSSGGMGRPGGQGWVFRCVGMRGLGRLVDVDDGDTGYPERIYNADTQDSDYHRSIFNADGSKMDVGEILKDLFDEFKTDLDTADATITGNAAYDQTELDTLSAVPDKVILRETNFENAVVQVLEKQGITFSIWVDPQTGKWHFVDRRSGALPAKTITLGTDTIDSDNIQTSTEDCFTAFKIFGRQGAGAHAVKKKIGHGSDQSGQTLSGLGKCWDPAEEANWTIEKSIGERDHGEIATIGVDSAPLQQIYVTCTGKDWDVDFWDGTGGSPAMGEAGTVAFPGWNSSKSYEIVSNTASKIVFDAGADYAAILAQISAGGKFTLLMRTVFADMFKRFYITDTGARDVLEGGDYGDEDCCPVLWKTGYWSGGSLAFRIPVPIKFEPTTEQWGSPAANVEVAVVAKYPLYEPETAGASLWDDLALEYCHRDSADGVVLQARYPTSGYTGSAYANHGVERERTLIVPEFDRPELEADFGSLAAILLKPHQDVRAWGSVTLRGVDTSFFDPRFRLFIAHASQTIGWATNLNASPVSIRFDLQAETTHVEISNDWRDDLNYADLLRQRVGEKLAEIEAEEGRKRDDFITCSKAAIGSHDSGEIKQYEIDIPTAPWSHPIIPQWKQMVQGGANGITRCDGKTYTPAGTWANPQSSCSARSHPHATAATYQCRSYPGYKGILPTNWGASVTMDGIILRAGDFGSYSNQPPMTQHVYPFICKEAGYPGSNVGTCGSQGMKDVLIVVPEDGGYAPSSQMTMAELIPSWARGYANALMFMNQAHMCLDDRLFILESNLYGPVEKTDCGRNGSANAAVITQICNCLRAITDYFGQYCNTIDTACSFPCTACTGGNTCTRPVTAPADSILSNSCTVSSRCCASCVVGGASDCFVIQ